MIASSVGAGVIAKNNNTSKQFFSLTFGPQAISDYTKGGALSFDGNSPKDASMIDICRLSQYYPVGSCGSNTKNYGNNF